MKGDREIVLEAVKQAEEALKSADEKLRNDKNFVLECIKQNSYCLKHVQKRFKNDRDVVAEAFLNGFDGINDVGSELLNDSPVLLAWSEACKTPTKYSNMEEQCQSVLRQIDYQANNECPERSWDREIMSCIRNIYLTKTGIVSRRVTTFTTENVDERKEEEEIERERTKLQKLEIEDLRIFRLLGSGAFASTYLCGYEKDLYAMKIYRNLTVLSEKKKLELIRRDAMYVDYHPNVVSILFHKENVNVDAKKLPDYEDYWKRMGAGTNSRLKTGIVIMKYHGTFLKQFCADRMRIDGFGLLTLKEVLRIMVGIMSGVTHLHDNLIVHRDLHMRNIFLECNKGRIWIGDFGCALDLRENKTKFVVSREDEYLFSLTSGGYDKYIRGGGASEMLAPDIKLAIDQEHPLIDYEFSDLYSVGIVGSILVEEYLEKEDTSVDSKMSLKSRRRAKNFGKQRVTYGRIGQSSLDLSYQQDRRKLAEKRFVGVRKEMRNDLTSILCRMSSTEPARRGEYQECLKELSEMLIG